MAGPPLFDPRQLPDGVIDPAKLERVNALIERLRARLVDVIDVGGAASRVAAMIEAHNQCFVRRCLYFAEAGAGAVAAGYGLASLTIARSLIETVASYLDFAEQVEVLLLDPDGTRLEQFVATAAFTAGAPTEPDAAEATDRTIRRQIEQMNRVRPGMDEEYKRLSEELNPSVFWTWIYFAQHDKAAGEVRFPSIAQSDADYLQWMIASVQLLAEFEEAVSRIEGAVAASATAAP